MKTTDFSRADVRDRGQRRFMAAERRRPRIRLAVALTAALSTAFVGLPAASAGPDDGKLILTERHIDSPFVVSDKAGHYDVRSKYSERVDGDFNETTAAFAESALWIGKGWQNPQTKKGSKYQITLPENGDFNFIGKPGETYVQAPSVSSGSNHSPIWYGYGAEEELPVADIPSGRVSLDLLSVDGPGDMEQYRYDSSGNFGVVRLVGTTDTSPHSISIKPHEHTHINTLFTKPGRYELTYRVSSLDKDGKLTTSAPRTQVIQVGGQRPLDTKTESLEDRFNKAPDGDAAAAHYRLSIAPKTDPQADGDDKLSTIVFDANNPNVTGTVTLFVDGYFLTDLPVKDGKATWDEQLSPKQSDIQAVFTPDAGAAHSGNADAEAPEESVAATAPRWISAPLAYSAGERKETTSAEKSADFPRGNNKRDMNIPQAGSTLTSKDIDVRYVPGDGETVTYYVEAKDPNFQGTFTGGVYSKLEDVENKGYPELGMEGAIVNGKGYFTIPKSYQPGPGGVLYINVIPHPAYGLADAKGVITDKYVPNQEHVGTVQLGDGPAGQGPQGEKPGDNGAGSQPPADSEAESPDSPETTPETTPEPSPGVPETTPETAPGDNAAAQQGRGVCVGKHLLHSGHVDILAKHQGNGLGISLKDDTRIVDKKSVERPLNDVALVVRDNTKEKRRDAHQGEKFDFLGKQEDGFYYLPQAQRPGVIWPGYNTEHIDFDNIDGAVSLNLQPRDVPEGATWGTFIDGQLGELPTVLSDSTKNDHSIESSFSSHTHIHWAFSKPGVYTFDASYSAKHKDGHEMKSETQEFVITVGNEALETCKTPKPGAEQESKPEGSPAEPAPAPGKPGGELKPEAPKDPQPGKPAPGKPGNQDKPGNGKQPEAPKKPENPAKPQPPKQPEKQPDNQSKPGGWSLQNFFSNFNPVHVLAPVLGIVFIARMVALFMELQPQVANFFAQGIPGLPKWGK
ncbi:choice-of-anchor M domain-containing protein [Corynebacterium propinquum]|uniref:Choice-of-anchor M domain-containing protein n=1 Tax=Corynebacterium propinquum TaxID=43769 RepID=A0ABT7G1M1_9CORY|nr:choice-of-anchor M domain-containing protein [Corynebacterium propinquum]MDK4300535.1 choice-of-anchor M domain-containing protein [Corynebacterium propinquum]QQU86271.1 choice-of-anchor M domain-containing protein [Corynebacterium propinquum]